MLVDVRSRVWSLLVVIVATLLVPVVAAPAAHADWTDPLGIGDLLDGTANVDRLGGCGTPGYEHQAECDAGDGAVSDSPAYMAAIAEIVKGKPTPANIGTTAKLCKGWGCLVLPTALLAGIIYDAFTDGGAIDLMESLNPGGVLGGPSFYGSAKTPIKIIDPGSVVATSDKGTGLINFDFTDAGPWDFYSHPCRYGCNIAVPITAQAYHKDTPGVIQDFNWTHTFGHNYGPGSQSMPILPALQRTTDWTVVSVHFDQSVSGGYGYDKGFYLGREAPQTPQDRAYLDRECRDSVTGDLYTVTAMSEPGSSVVVPPSCDPGDSTTELETGIERAGETPTKEPHTRYDTSDGARTTGLDVYPDCAGLGACTYSVRVDGLPCTVGAPGCTSWTVNEAAQCYYGPYIVDRSLCGFLERAYEWQRTSVPATYPNTDGIPGTWDPPNPALDPGPSPSPSPTATASPTATPSPSPTATPGTPAQCQSANYDLGPVTSELVSAVDATHLAQASNISTVYGHRPSDPFPDHPSGIAADFMVSSSAAGSAIAQHLIANAAEYRVKYILWDQRSWNPQRGTWVDMADRGSDTANHKDHVHLSVTTAGTTLCPGVAPSPEYGEDLDVSPESRECFPSGWSAFNPWQWVYMPVMCALSDAFEPDPVTTATRAADVRAALETRGPGPAIAEVGAIFDSVPDGAGCQGPPITLTLGGETFTFYLLNACDEPMKTVAGFSHALGTMLVVVGGGLGIVRAVGAAFNLDISMGRGGGSDGV